MALASNALLPLVYWYGHPEITRNPLLMDRLIRNLGENMNDRFEHYPEGVLSILWDPLSMGFQTYCTHPIPALLCGVHQDQQNHILELYLAMRGTL
jgi:hypothetical protein